MCQTTVVYIIRKQRDKRLFVDRAVVVTRQLRHAKLKISRFNKKTGTLTPTGTYRWIARLHFWSVEIV